MRDSRFLPPFLFLVAVAVAGATFALLDWLTPSGFVHDFMLDRGPFRHPGRAAGRRGWRRPAPPPDHRRHRWKEGGAPGECWE